MTDCCDCKWYRRTFTGKYTCSNESEPPDSEDCIYFEKEGEMNEREIERNY